MMLIPKWGNYPGDGGGGITLVIDKLGVTKATIYRYVAPDGSLRNRGRQVLAR